MIFYFLFVLFREHEILFRGHFWARNTISWARHSILRARHSISWARNKTNKNKISRSASHRSLLCLMRAMLIAN